METNDTSVDIPKEILAHLQAIVDTGGLDAEATLVEVAGDVISLEVNGPDASLLIGRKGQALEALQYLLLVMTTHDRTSAHRLRIHLDCDGYRKRRADSLRDLALSLAAQVKDTGEEAVLEPLNPMERRIVHTAVADDPDIETYSEGEEPNRYIVIAARKK